MLRMIDASSSEREARKVLEWQEQVARRFADEYEVPKYRQVVEGSIRPSDPSDFAQYFPSTKELFIRHDNTTYDGDINLQVDIEDRKKSAVQLFHMRMRDLKTREFSLRRYARLSGLEVCHSSSRKHAVPCASDLPRRLGQSRRPKGLDFDVLTDCVSSASPRVYSSGYDSTKGASRGEDEVNGDYCMFRRHRRGRRNRQKGDSTGDSDFEEQAPFEREFQFRSPENQPSMPGMVRLDSQCHIPLVVSRRWIVEAGREAEISTDFKAPTSISISGHPMHFTGIIRNMIFNPKGSTVTYRRDFLVCDQLDTFTDFLIGAKFMLEQWSVLFGFGKMKRMIAGWFTHKKETPEEKAQAQILKARQEQEANEAELRMRARKAQEAREKEVLRRQQEEAEQARNRQ